MEELLVIGDHSTIAMIEWSGMPFSILELELTRQYFNTEEGLSQLSRISKAVPGRDKSQMLTLGIKCIYFELMDPVSSCNGSYCVSFLC
jgi:hypothetical protein